MKRLIKIAVLVAFIAGIGLWLVFRGKGKIETPQGTATLSWSKGEDAGVAGYKIYYGTTPRNGDCPDGGYEKNKNVGNVGEFTLTGLEPGRTYYFSVSALNAATKESCFSAEMSKKIPAKTSLIFSRLWQKIRGK